MNKPDIEPNVIISEYNEGMTMNAIARKHGLHTEYVRQVLKRNGITGSHSEGAKRLQARKLEEKWESAEKLLNDDFDVTKIHKELGITRKRFIELLSNHNYDYDKLVEDQQSRHDAELCAKLTKWRAQGLSVAEMGAMLGKSVSMTGSYLKKFGLTNKSDRTDIKDDAILMKYNEGYTIREIAKFFNCSHDTITKRLAKYDVSDSRVDGIKRHFERTHGELWPEIEKDLRHGHNPYGLAGKYNIREDNIKRLMERNGYVDNTDMNPYVLAKTLQNKMVTFKDSQPLPKLISECIIDFINTNGFLPTIHNVAKASNHKYSDIVYALDKYDLHMFVNHARLSNHVSTLVVDLEALGINYELNNRTVLFDNEGKCKEIDVWFPDYNFGIEINPVYTHSVDDLVQRPIHRDYHQKKSLLAEKYGIGLIQAYDDDFYDARKYQVLLRQIQARMNDKLVIGARECVCKPIDRTVACPFIDQWHFQGSKGLHNNFIGMFYRNKLVSVISIEPTRFGEGDYEIVRYCSDPSYAITGGFAKIFNYAIENIEVGSKIISYVDLNKRFRAENVYENNGFKLDAITPPGYSWYSRDGRKMLSRYMTTRRKLADAGYDIENYSEKEIMHQRGYLRVFGAGSKRYVYTV